ncbi:hypothetical protein EJB05_24986 [Eragrostis curvula]|uniref:Protein kinase domain-containing protein n=1 Tax=Eragrostis curvula TaxID=38414 RepID=A0A5J9VC06_9POAL|nr:hypothetical protein EJB05_24986 [Eragrostis curvula]
MATILAAVLILAVLHHHLPPAEAVTSICSSNGRNYTEGSSYAVNLGRVIDSLPTKASSSPSLFATATVGAGANQTVYAIGLCRGDLVAYTCLVCLRSGLSDAKLDCPLAMDVSIDVADTCHLRFSNLDFVASTNNSVQQAFFSTYYPTVASSVAGRFNALVAQLLQATADYAASGSSERRFATGEMVVDEDTSQLGGLIPNIFATAQCTPDLTPAQCGACLAGAMAEMPRQVFPRNSSGASFVGERCGLRFATYSFYNGNAMVQLHARPQGKKTATTTVLITVFAILAELLALSLVGFWVWKKKSSQRKAPLFINVEDVENFESIFIGLSILRSATNNFDEKNKLGEGGFGAVYKGALPDGQEIAVKRLYQSTKQGLGQMKNELAMMVKLQHKNLVRIIGVCLEDGEHMLVYEYMPNKSLDTIIFDPDRSVHLDWGSRFRIINGIARGLQYLHEHSQMTIVHRDLKASNVLLDADMKPKISDFGLAKIFTDDQTRKATSLIIGTLGYMSPEYALRGHYTTKLDVFSFGILVLEIVTGRRNNYAVNTEDLFSLVWKHWVEGTIAELSDPGLGRHYPRGEVLKCINIGLLCVQQNPTDRPSMSTVVVMLGSDTISLEAPYRPAYVLNRSRSYIDTTELVKEPLCSEPQSSITELEPR